MLGDRDSDSGAENRIAVAVVGEGEARVVEVADPGSIEREFRRTGQIGSRGDEPFGADRSLGKNEFISRYARRRRRKRCARSTGFARPTERCLCGGSSAGRSRCDCLR
jgi:hypothetical protein